LVTPSYLHQESTSRTHRDDSAIAEDANSSDIESTSNPQIENNGIDDVLQENLCKRFQVEGSHLGKSD
jgi:hypothetical protein